jgi:large subunit ribosomal protein L6e
MVKTAKDLLAKRKSSRKAHLDENKSLKSRKTWYPITDMKGHFKRACKKPRASHIPKQLTPGQIVILLSGRFRGRRVVFLKKLDSGLLLVTGPYKLNGVPLKRVNQAYVLPTSTKINIDANVAQNVTDKTFVKVTVERKDFFETDEVKKQRITKDRTDAQVQVDTEVIKQVKSVDMLKDYLKCRFALKSGDKPHLMKF